MKKTAIIIGAGPAGLTAAYELLKKTDIKPIIYEESQDIGGISKTINHNGNRIDIGGHRFFSKSDLVMNWWLDILPLQSKPAIDDILLDRTLNLPKKSDDLDPQKKDKLMLKRTRLSRILFLKKFFDYPVSLSFGTIINLGFLRIFKIALTYFWATVKPIKPELSLQDFLINRFGKELYNTFFKSYTEKVWGIACDQIPAEWGAQRIKGLSIGKTIYYAIKKLFVKEKSIKQKNTETSLIENFLYPKLGPGQMWQEVAELVKNLGGEIHLNHKVIGIKSNNNFIENVKVINTSNNKKDIITGNYFFSSMPVKDLIGFWDGDITDDVLKTANELKYRDFITVGILLDSLKIKNHSKIKTLNNIIPDTWIYIQEKDVIVGRIQIFNNWSPYLVKDINNVWLGLEYFCNEGDDFWQKSDLELKELAKIELNKIGFIDLEQDILDSVVIRVPKTYPAYFGSYNNFDCIKNFVNQFENLFLVGRNGMHRYNNMDHSMLTAMMSVKNIIENNKNKENIWQINAEQDYHEA